MEILGKLTDCWPRMLFVSGDGLDWLKCTSVEIRGDAVVGLIGEKVFRKPADCFLVFVHCSDVPTGADLPARVE